MKISVTTARRMALRAQLLDGRTKLPPGREGVAQAIEKMGYIQIDTIAVIQRAHHHTLWTRRPDYDSGMLDRLQAEDRRVFEYWGHAASYLPMSDYRYYLPRMKKSRDPYNKWEKERLEKYGHMMTPVLERIRAEGPLSSKDFVPPTGKKRGTWWDWRPAKVALEMLFWRGELMITRRRKFERVYDLTERVLPGQVDTTMPTDEEVGRFFVRRALAAYGVASESEIREHIHAADRAAIVAGLRDLVEVGEVVKLGPLRTDGADNYALSDTLGMASKFRKMNPRLYLLSPFDNLIIQRERTKRLFGFDYALECYVPAGKRKDGYFVLPILFGENLVGRLDPKADRKNKNLVIRGLRFEPGYDDFDTCLPALAQRLWDLARFNSCEKVTIKKTLPAAAGEILPSLLKSLKP